MLIVDDEPSILFTLSRYFQAKGYEVDCAKDVQEVESLLARGHYDVLIADVSLAGGHGREGLEVVRSVRDQGHKTGILMLTAYGNAEIELEARRRGADAFLYKPKPLAEVAQVVMGLAESNS
jgi:DNA-binding response OmpR family regulator